MFCSDGSFAELMTDQLLDKLFIKFNFNFVPRASLKAFPANISFCFPAELSYLSNTSESWFTFTLRIKWAAGQPFHTPLLKVFLPSIRHLYTFIT